MSMFVGRRVRVRRAGTTDEIEGVVLRYDGTHYWLKGEPSPIAGQIIEVE
jgi:hypothetical protein